MANTSRTAREKPRPAPLARRMPLAQGPHVLAHWYRLVEGLQVSPRTFYAALEERIDERRIPSLERERVTWREGGPFSGSREYLRIRYRDFAVDLCGAPFGRSFFVSSWLLEEPRGLRSFLLAIPGVRFLFEHVFQPATYYRIDTALMFQQAVHTVVLGSLDALTDAHGLRRLSRSEEKPVFREFFEPPSSDASPDVAQ